MPTSFRGKEKLFSRTRMSTGPMKTKMQTSSVVGLFVGTMTEFVKEGCQRTENAVIDTYLLHIKPSSFIRSV